MRTVPTAVPGITDIKDIAAGAFHVVMLKNDSTVWACGGRLGCGTSGHETTVVEVPGMTGGVVSIDADSQYSLAIKNDKSLWAWGGIGIVNHGMGDGTTDYLYSPKRIW